MNKNKQITFSDAMAKTLRLQRTQGIQESADNILVKKYEDEIREQNPSATLSEIKKIIKQKYSQEYDDLKNGVISPLYKDKAQDIIRLAQNSTIITNSKGYQHSDKYIENTKLADIYSGMKIKTDLFDVMEQFGTSFNNTSKFQTGSSLIQNVVAFDKLNYSHTRVKAAQTLEQANKAYDFFKKSDKFLSYDYETMGGTDEFGYKRVDALIEFAYGIYDKQLGTTKEAQTIVGLSASQEKRFRDMIKDVDKTGFKSNEQEIIYRRIGLYGHKDTVMTKGKDGMYEMQKMADVGGGYKFSQREIEEGFNRLTRIYNEQDTISTQSGLKAWQEKYAEMLGHMNDQSLSVLDYNGTVADRPWQNKFLATMGLNKEQEKAFLQKSGLNSMFMDTSSERFFDVRIPTRFAADNVGADAYYTTKEAREVLKSNTPFSQEGLTRMLFGDMYEGGAHTAGFDAKLLANLVASPNGKNQNGEIFIDKLMRDANLNKSAANGSIRTGGLDLLMANESTQFWKGGSGAINYVYDPVNKTYRMANQYSFGENGKASKEIVRESAIKRGRLYTVDFAGEVDMTSEWVKNMDGLHDDFAQQKLYALRLNPYFDEKIAGSHQGLRGHSVMFFNSKDQMEATLSNMYKIGERDNINQKFKMVSGEAGKEVQEAFKTYSVKNGKLVASESPVSLEGIIARATKGDVNDTAARMVREDSWKKSMNFSSLYNKLSDFNGGSIDKHQANKIMLELMQSKDRQISSKVSQGKVLKFSDIQESLGYTLDGENYNLIANTFNNQMTAFEYMSSQMPIAQTITNHLTEQGMDPFRNANVTQFKFEHILNTLTEKGIEEISKNPKQARELWYNSSDLQMFGKDINYFNFNTKDFFKDKLENSFQAYSKPTIDEDVLRVDLGPGKEYKFVDNLVRKNVYGASEMSAFQKNNEGITQLRSFISEVRDSNQYKGLFNSFDSERLDTYTRSDVLAKAMIQEMKDFRTSNPTAGYISEAYSQDATIRSRVLGHLAKDPDKLKSMISDIDKSLPNFVQVAGDTDRIKVQVQDMISNILVDQIDPLEYSKQYGFSKEQQKHFSWLYNQAQEEYTNFMTDFVSAFTQAQDVNFIYDKDSKYVGLMQNGKKVDLSLPKLKALDGNFFIDMGSTKVALHGKLDGSKALNKGYYHGPDDVKMITNFGDAVNQTKGMVNFYKAAKKGDSMNEALHRSTSVMSNLASHLREGASVDYNDILDIQTPYRVDYSDIMGLAPLMRQAGVLEGRDWRDKDFLGRVSRFKDWKNSNTTQRELLQKNIPELLRVVAEQNGGYNEDTWLGLVSKNLSFSLKESQVAEGIGMVGGISHRAGWQFNANGRPVINQTRSVLYRTSEWKKAIEKGDYVGRNISLNPLTSNDSTKALYNRKITGLGQDNRTSLELYVGKANVSDVHYRSAVSEHFLTKGELSAREQKVFDRLKGVNLTEQEQLMDTRIADDFFNRMQEQKINSRKQLSFYMDVNEATIKEADELRGMMSKFSINPNTGKVEFTEGKGVYKNRHEKLLSIAGYDKDYIQSSKVSGKFGHGYFTKTDGIMATADEINQMISGAKTVDEAKNIMADIFDEAFYVKSTDQVGYKKILQGYVEKGMAYSPYFGLGETDDKINAYIKGLSSQKDFAHGDLTGKVKTVEFIQEEILDKYDISLGNKVGIKSKEELKDLIYKERHEAFDTLRGILGDGKDFSIISNHIQSKHQNRQLAFEELTGSMKYRLMQQGYEEPDAMQKIWNDIGEFTPAHEFKDGAFHYKNQLSGGKDHYDLGGIKSVLNDSENHPEYAGIAEGLKFTADKKQIGSYTTTSLSESRNFQWLSGRMDESMVEDLSRLDEKINNATGFEAERLKVQRRDLASAYNYNTRGQKITDREIQLLNLQRYDDNVVQTMQDQLIKNGDASLFEQTMGHVLQKDANGRFVKSDGNYQLTEEAKGRSILSSYTESIKNKYLTENGELLNSAADDYAEKMSKYYINDSVRDGINRLVMANDGQLSKDTAEQIYSITRGAKALEFNAGKLSIEAMQKEGFEIKKAGEIYKTFDQGRYSLEHEDSFFNKNLIVDFGEDFKLASERYVALPYSPASMTGDTVIREKFQKKLTATLSSAQELNSFSYEQYQQGITKESIKTRVARHREELKDEIDLYSLSGKDGAAGQFYVRQDASVMGQTSSAVAMDPTKMTGTSKKIIAEAWGLSNVNNNKDMLKALGDLNDPALSKSQFMGKSILEHYSEGRYINARWGSVEQFEEMGVFSKTFMSEHGFKNKQQAIDYLSTEGILTNTIRTPSIKYDSTTPTMMYLDSSLKGTRTKWLLEGQLGATGDNDGDNVSSSIWKINGEDSITASRLGSKSKNELGWADTRMSMMNRAVGSNQYWHDVAYKTLEEDTANALTNANFFTIAGDAAIDNKIYAEFNINPSSEDIKTKHETLNQFRQEFATANKTKYNISNVDDFKFDLGERGQLDDIDNYLAGMADQTLASSYRDAVIFDNAFMRTEVGAIAKVRKNAIGEANLSLYKLRKSADLALPHYGDNSQLRYMLQSSFEAIEQEVISSKKGSVRDQVTKVEDFKKALNAITSGNSTSTTEGKAMMYQWMESNIKKDLVSKNVPHLQAINGYMPKNLSGDEAFDYMAKNVVEALSSFNTQELNSLKAYESMGASRRAIARTNAANTLGFMSDDTSSLKNAGMHLAQKSELMNATMITRNDALKASSERLRQSVEFDRVMSDGNAQSKTLQTAARKTVTEMGEALSKGITEMTTSKMGLGVLGMAAAYMITGFIGSNASQPADNAQQMSNQEQEPMLSDAGYNGGGGYNQQQSGYVINVHGSGPSNVINRSQQSITQSLSNSISSDISIKMNIMESNGNINDRYLDELLANAIGR